ncbi:RICIN domain-containing protein [Actinomadura scrupuli]|uniref:RICIN domain-containing protein n=1 Tax=Actinomadura scrupuli TaxID=559629 RepID=UPI003D955ACE
MRPSRDQARSASPHVTLSACEVCCGRPDPAEVSGKCLDDNGQGTADGNKVQIWDCTGSASQTWTVYNDSTIRIFGKCLDVKGGGTANNTPVDLSTCTGAGAQKWEVSPTGYLINPQSGKCLDDPGSSSTNGTQVDLWTCTVAANERWTLPASALPASDSYTYDGTGNRLTRTADGLTTTYSYDAADQLIQQISGSSTTSFGYDNSGNQTAAGSTTYAYNAENQLAKVTSGSMSYTYSYDFSGNRAATFVNGSLSSKQRWDTNNVLPMLATENTASGSLLADYHYDPLGEPLSSKTSAGAYFDHHDWLGSTTDVTTSNGAPQLRLAYDTYGATTATGLAASPPRHPLNYTGQYQDLSTGLYDMRARNYNSNIGQFTTRDPLENYTHQAYAYAADAPSYMTDPTGASLWPAPGESIGHWLMGDWVWEHQTGIGRGLAVAGLFACVGGAEVLCPWLVRAGFGFTFGVRTSTMIDNQGYNDPFELLKYGGDIGLDYACYRLRSARSPQVGTMGKPLTIWQMRDPEWAPAARQRMLNQANGFGLTWWGGAPAGNGSWWGGIPH